MIINDYLDEFAGSLEDTFGAQVAFNWTGAYASGTTYSPDDLVRDGYSTYLCVATATGIQPSADNGSHFVLFAGGGMSNVQVYKVVNTATTAGTITHAFGADVDTAVFVPTEEGGSVGHAVTVGVDNRTVTVTFFRLDNPHVELSLTVNGVLLGVKASS